MNLIDFFILFGNFCTLVYNLIMETLDLIEKEQEIAKNQIAFDFDNLPVEEDLPEEESSVLPEEALSPQNFEWVGEEVLFVAVKVKGNLHNDFEREICGRPMLDWVLMAGGQCEKKIVDDNDNIIDVLKNIKTDKQYIAVFYSDTPLVNVNLVYKIMDYFVRNRLNAMTLLRGYVFKTSFLQSIDSFILGCLDKFDEKAFLQVKENKDLVRAEKLLQNKILAYHEKNGVAFFDKSSVVIDADVEIESGVIIKNNNILKGNTYIGKNCVLQENNMVYNSIIGDESSLLSCRVIDSKITNGKEIVGVDLIGREY